MKSLKEWRALAACAMLGAVAISPSTVRADSTPAADGGSSEKKGGDIIIVQPPIIIADKKKK